MKTDPNYVSKNFRKIPHPEQEISLYWPNISKDVRHLTDLQTNMKFVTIWERCTKIPGMSPKNSRKIFHPEQEIYLYLSNFRKEVDQLTDWQTYKNLKCLANSVQTYQECLQKNSERYLIQNRRYPYIGLISVRK